MKQTIRNIMNADRSKSLESIYIELEKFIRNDQRIRIIPYLYPFFAYEKRLNCTEQELNSIFDNMWNNNRFASEEVALYIHIPFCSQKCNYCQWYTVVKPKNEIDRYVNLIIKEMELYSKKINLKNKTIKTIYFGGGTPNLLTLNQLECITEAIKKLFVVDNVTEFTIEIFPYKLNENDIIRFKRMGVTRISMGIQTFDDKILDSDFKRYIHDEAYVTDNHRYFFFF